MRRWERLIFGLSSLVILLLIGLALHEVDMPSARFVRSFNIHEVNRAGDFLAIPGQGEVLAGLFVLLGLTGWRLKNDLLKALGIRGLLALLCTTVVVQLLKHLVGRPRPRFAHADEVTFGPSLAVGYDAFPSGHTVNAFAAAAVLAWFLPRFRVPIFLIAGLVGVSRVLRGSHFPTDVFAGVIFGVLVGSMAAAGIRRWWNEALPALIRTGIPIVVCVFLVVWVALHAPPQRSEEHLHLMIGAMLIVGGMLLRVASLIRPHAALLTGGTVALMLGMAVAVGPWWIAAMCAVSLLPMIRNATSKELGTGSGQSQESVQVFPNPWVREGLVAGAVVLTVITMRALQGLLPLISG